MNLPYCPYCFGPTDTGMRCLDWRCKGARTQEFYATTEGTTAIEEQDMGNYLYPTQTKTRK